MCRRARWFGATGVSSVPVALSAKGGIERAGGYTQDLGPPAPRAIRGNRSRWRRLRRIEDRREHVGGRLGYAYPGPPLQGVGLARDRRLQGRRGQRLGRR